MLAPASRRYTCDQPSRSDHQNASWSSFVTYQLTGSAVGGPISTNVREESRAMIRYVPVFAFTDARYALFDPRVNHVTYSLSEPALQVESRAEPAMLSWFGTGCTFTARFVLAATSMI